MEFTLAGDLNKDVEMVKYIRQKQGTDKGGHVCHGAMSWHGCRGVSWLSKCVTDARMWMDPVGGPDR